jgi:SAM-dependent methyltransferase
MEQTNCNLCGGSSVHPYLIVQDLLLERLDVRTQLVQCQQCGLVYQNPRPTLAEMGQHYPPEYDSYVDHAAQKRNPLLQKAIDYGFNKRCRYVTKRRAQGTLLDIGCAAGSFLLAMQGQGGWQVQGVEITPQVAQLARERHGLNVFSGTLEEAAFADAHFDAVTMWDVLEHLHDPLAGLQEIHRILNPDGVLVIRVPNLASWDAKLFGTAWAGLDAPRHLYVFTPQTLSSMLEKAGFETLEHSCAIGSYVTFVLSVRFWLTARRVSPATSQRIMKALYHPLARLVSAPFFSIPTLFKTGPLVVTTARKKVSAASAMHGETHAEKSDV